MQDVRQPRQPMSPEKLLGEQTAALETAERGGGIFFFSFFLNLFESPGCTNGNGEGCVGVSGKDLANWKIISEDESVCPGWVRPRAQASKQTPRSFTCLPTTITPLFPAPRKRRFHDAAHLTPISKEFERNRSSTHECPPRH